MIWWQTLGTLALLGAGGGLVRWGMRIFQEFKKDGNVTVDDDDKIQATFDVGFGVVAGALVWLGFSELSLTKSVVALALTAGYSGASFVSKFMNKK